MLAYYVFTCLLFIWSTHGQLAPGRQLQYSFNMKTRMSPIPTEPENNYESSIFGKITLRRFDEDSLEFRVDEVKSKIIRTSEKFKKADSEAPGFDERLNLHFFAKYGVDGKLVGIDTTHSEDFQSLNTMKAIASQFQIDEKAVDSYDSTAKNYDSFEETVYGSCPCNYNIEPKDENAFSLIKMMNCTDMDKDESFNVEVGHCQTEYNDPINIRNEKKYELIRKPYGWAISSIMALNEIKLTFFDLDSEKNAKIEITQEYTLMDDIESDYKFDQVNELQHHKLKIEPIRHEPNDLYHITNREKIPEMLNTGLKRMINMLDHAEINISDLRLFNRNSLMDMLRTMRLLNFEHLKEYFDSLEKEDMEEMRKLFIGILPLVGTNDAMAFILNLIENKVISDSFAETVIQEAPFHLKNLNMGSMDKLFGFISMNGSFAFTNSALMSYSNFLSNGIKLNPENEKLQMRIDEFIVEMEKGDYDTQLLYLSALSNIKSPKVFGFLEKLVKKQTDFPMERPSHMRTMAMKAMLDQNIAEPEKMNNICWPILVDTNEDIELRAMAMEILMMNPSREDMTKIFTMMQTEKDDELYNYYFTMLESFTRLRSCFENSYEYAREILALPRRSRPKYSASMARFSDFLGWKMGATAIMKFSSIGNLVKNKFMNFKFELSPQKDHYNVNRDTVYIYARPVNIDDERFNAYANLNTFKYMMLIEKLFFNNFLKMEIIVYRNNKIISVNSNLVEDYIEELDQSNFINSIIKQEKRMEYKIVEKLSGDTTILTDIGGLAVLSINTPIITRTMYESSFKKPDNGIFKRDTDLYSIQTYGLKVFHPINSVWHGLHRNILVNLQIPIDLQFKLKDILGNMEIAINLVKDDKPYEFALQAFLFNEYFIDGPNVTQYCDWCKDSFLQYPLENESNIDWDLFEGDERTSELTDTTYKYEYFDCREKDDSDMDDKKVKTPEICGIKLSAKPNRTKLIMNIDATMYNSDPHTEPTKTFNPSWQAHMGIKMMQKDVVQEQMQLNFNLNSSYSDTFNTSLMMVFDKPGKELYYFMMDTNETNMYSSMESTTSIRAGYDDEISVDVAMKAEMLNDIDSDLDETIFKKCMDEEIEVRICTKEQTVFRKYIIDVTYANVSQIVHNIMETASMWMAFENPEPTIDTEGKLRFIVEYPLGEDKVNVEIETPKGNTNTSSPYKIRKFHYLTASGHVGMLLPMTEFPYNLYERCQVNTKMESNVNGEVMNNELGEEWVEYVHNSAKTFTILLKRFGDGKMAIRVMNFDRVMEIHPTDGFEITIDDKKMEHDKYGYYRTEWFDFKVTEKRIFVHLKTWMSYFNFDGNAIDMSLINVSPFKGRCYD